MCLCGNSNVHTQECKRRQGYERMYKKRKERRKERIENHCCGDCGELVEPKIIYPSRCGKCNYAANKKKNEKNNPTEINKKKM